MKINFSNIKAILAQPIGLVTFKGNLEKLINSLQEAVVDLERQTSELEVEHKQTCANLEADCETKISQIKQECESEIQRAKTENEAKMNALIAEQERKNQEYLSIIQQKDQHLHLQSKQLEQQEADYVAAYQRLKANLEEVLREFNQV